MMELLQNRRYKPGDITISYFHEIRMQIESLLDVCREGDISVHESVNIIYSEISCSMDYQAELEELEEKLTKDKTNKSSYKREHYERTTENSFKSTSVFEDIDNDLNSELDRIAINFTREDLQKDIGDMEKYNNYLYSALDELGEILDNNDYKKKRKEKIKRKIILEESAIKTDIQEKSYDVGKSEIKEMDNKRLDANNRMLKIIYEGEEQLKNINGDYWLINKLSDFLVFLDKNGEYEAVTTDFIITFLKDREGQSFNRAQIEKAKSRIKTKKTKSGQIEDK